MVIRTIGSLFLFALGILAQSEGAITGTVVNLSGDPVSDHYKHISEKAARRASDALSRVKAEQRAEARAKMQKQAGVDTGLIHSDAIPTVIDVGSGQSAVVH